MCLFSIINAGPTNMKARHAKIVAATDLNAAMHGNRVDSPFAVAVLSLLCDACLPFLLHAVPTADSVSLDSSLVLACRYK